eukprot:CAMPEP_0204381718 /NCGR_PEP_ID=MMETSP0469-20131031/54485_1 /ASSEMBLY_ACC=CAM_ASM_000384 /TAXON_ID=2969 /ORGANISM="Oxyrrhis marina" /LENGTH=291 /DNA_ID=CAMNT_0051373625 /DNA_START=1 /DNA_END=876 /DNA_ORIENTATION=-
MRTQVRHSLLPFGQSWADYEEDGTPTGAEDQTASSRLEGAAFCTSASESPSSAPSTATNGGDVEYQWHTRGAGWSDLTPPPHWLATGGNRIAVADRSSSPWGSTEPEGQQSPIPARRWVGHQQSSQRENANLHSVHAETAYHPRNTHTAVAGGPDASWRDTNQRPGTGVWPAAAARHQEWAPARHSTKRALEALQGRWCDEQDPTVTYVVTGLSCVRTMTKNKVTVRQYEFEVDEESQVIPRGDKSAVELRVHNPACCTPTRVIWRCNRDEQAMDGKKRRSTFVWIRPRDW